MAKGRRLTTSLSERYLGAYTGHSHSNGVPADGSDFSEEDVWSTADGDNGGQFDGINGQYDYYENGHARGSEWESHTPHAPRSPTAGGLSLAFEGEGGKTSSRIVHQLCPQDGVVLGARPARRQQRHMATSAPMDVPHWGKILRVDSSESFDEPDSGVDPPHEYLTRSRKAGATSVFEGVGRTLKGRDMSRLRDAVWSQTGFDG